MPSLQSTAALTTSTGSCTWPASGTGPGTEPYAIVAISGTYASVQGVIEGSLDGGTTFSGIVAARMDQPALEWSTISPADNATRHWQVPLGPYGQIRWRNTALSTGTVNARIFSSPVSLLPYPASLLAGAVDQAEWSYVGSFSGLASAASSTDLVTIIGSATRTVKVKKVVINGAATTAAACQVTLQKYSTADTGGTPASGAALPVAIPVDSSAPAATAVLNSYTAVPTLGTLVGLVYASQLCVTTLTTPTPANILTIDLVSLFGPNGVVLHGVAQQLAINLNVSTPGSGNLFGGSIAFTES